MSKSLRIVLVDPLGDILFSGESMIAKPTIAAALDEHEEIGDECPPTMRSPTSESGFFAAYRDQHRVDAQLEPTDPADEIRQRGDLERQIAALRTEQARLQNIDAIRTEMRKRRRADSKKKQKETKLRRERERREGGLRARGLTRQLHARVVAVEHQRAPSPQRER